MEKTFVPEAAVGAYYGVELWVQKRSVRGSLYFHFDVADAVKQRAERIVLPTWSSVLYLSSCGGPTLVLDNHLETENEAVTP